jgi:hypothetical protein
MPRSTKVSPSLSVPPSFFDRHATLVKHDLLLFHESLVGLNPSLPNQRAPTELPSPSFVQPAKTDDLLELARRRDRLLLFRPKPPIGASLATGVSLFAASLIASAHAPRPLRGLFDGSIHLGPAVFDSGGIGMGVGGTLRL